MRSSPPFSATSQTPTAGSGTGDAASAAPWPAGAAVVGAVTTVDGEGDGAWSLVTEVDAGRSTLARLGLDDVARRPSQTADRSRSASNSGALPPADTNVEASPP